MYSPTKDFPIGRMEDYDSKLGHHSQKIILQSECLLYTPTHAICYDDIDDSRVGDACWRIIEGISDTTSILLCSHSHCRGYQVLPGSHY